MQNETPMFTVSWKNVANGFLVHNSDGMKRYLKELVPSTFEDITAMVALYRPGPMQFIPDYIERKHGNQTIFRRSESVV